MSIHTSHFLDALVRANFSTHASQSLDSSYHDECLHSPMRADGCQEVQQCREEDPSSERASGSHTLCQPAARDLGHRVADEVGAQDDTLHHLIPYERSVLPGRDIRSDECYIHSSIPAPINIPPNVRNQ